MNDIAISCNNITKTYPMYNDPKDRFKEALHPFRKIYHKDFYALKDVTFEVKKGETVGIIGQNGAGKSTLLKIITGVLTPTSGSIQVNGIISSILELGTGFNSELTGIENIYVNSSLMGVSEEAVDKKLERIIAFADIGDHINQPVRGYSSGMFARLAFAIAISIDPDILIVDEALAVGDMNFQAKCMTAMKRIQDNGTTILFVSHDISSVKSLCERGVYIKKGSVHAVGDAGHVAELYMADMRMQHNADNQFTGVEPAAAVELVNATTQNKMDELAIEFDKKVSLFRHGTGEAKITYVEVLDINDSLVEEAEFNQQVRVKIHIKSYVNKKISVNFHLLDDKKINIVTCNFLQAGTKLYAVKPGDCLIVEYVLNLPLQHNVYSLNTMITSPIIPDINIEYIDVVPDSYSFKIAKRPNSTLWSKVDLFPKLTISKL
ncbi:ABC transporter ATP-binding protein [Psychromonas sp. MB-3u-54]|uniref:ABC transporter ATP-binding protein n=1 Tax=Psychromonas sp. MB-3u-54 TaxID=2058319 RepID=UPI0018E31FF0|nr:ABC transporter ATP-binding protein [Psychromonas sp. MB-3u-54]